MEAPWIQTLAEGDIHAAHFPTGALGKLKGGCVWLGTKILEYMIAFLLLLLQMFSFAKSNEQGNDVSKSPLDSDLGKVWQENCYEISLKLIRILNVEETYQRNK